MDMFAKFDENQAMTLHDIKETKRFKRTDGCTDNVKTVYPPQTKFAGVIKIPVFRVTRPYLHLLVKPRSFYRFSGKKYNFMYFERHLAFQIA